MRSFTGLVSFQGTRTSKCGGLYQAGVSPMCPVQFVTHVPGSDRQVRQERHFPLRPSVSSLRPSVTVFLFSVHSVVSVFILLVVSSR